MFDNDMLYRNWRIDDFMTGEGESRPAVEPVIDDHQLHVWETEGGLAQ